MASPLPTSSSSKRTVNLAGGVRGSRIRRDPPPVAPKITEGDPEEREARTVLIGVVSFAVALMVITIGISSFYGWSPGHYTIELRDE